MPLGLEIVVPFTGDPDPTLPYASGVDSRATPGSLALIELSHSSSPLVGTPVNGQAIPNPVWQSAAALIGSGDSTSLASAFSSDFTSGEGVFERTSKGALHGVVSRTAQGGHSAFMLFSVAVKNYIAANPTRAYAFFMWARVTRTAASDTNMRDYFIGNVASGASNFLVNGGLANVTGMQRIALSMPTGWTGSPNSNAGLNASQAPAWGNTAPYNGSNANDGRSYILYSLHVVDVAASGMTYAQLNALDQAAYDEAFGTGGRFNGDTFTPPANLIAN